MNGSNNNIKNIDEWVEEYMEFRRFSNLGTTCYYTLRGFANFIRKRCNDLQLTQDRINAWCVKSPNSSNSSFNTRIRLLQNLLDYINIRSESSFSCVKPLKNDRVQHDPALFSEEELVNFFKACDELTVSRRYGYIHDCQTLILYEAPVFFRLLYSTGLRMAEARHLMVTDMDLQRGLLYIKHGKGYKERIVALHPSMTQLLVRYQQIMCRLMPGRKVLFPDVNDKIHGKQWICKLFRKLWDKYNNSKDVVAYSFRHNYAVHNINNMPRDGYVINENLIALSKSMGHSTLDSTLYYYHLVPKFAQIYATTMNETLEQIIPDYE